MKKIGLWLVICLLMSFLAVNTCYAGSTWKQVTNIVNKGGRFAIVYQDGSVSNKEQSNPPDKHDRVLRPAANKASNHGGTPQATLCCKVSKGGKVKQVSYGKDCPKGACAEPSAAGQDTVD